MQASSQGHTEIVQMLVEIGSDINIRNKVSFIFENCTYI
jgi:ankyrin repeat protein